MGTKPNVEEGGQPWEAVPPTGPILRPATAAEYLGLSVSGYYKQAARGLVPMPIVIGRRASGVPRPWLDAVIASRAPAVGGAL